MIKRDVMFVYTGFEVQIFGFEKMWMLNIVLKN